jgi:RHS repeat-associated protein
MLRTIILSFLSIILYNSNAQIDTNVPSNGLTYKVKKNGNDDLFFEKISYDLINNKLANTAKYNGAISAVEWKVTPNGVKNAYKYEYDNRNQILSGEHLIHVSNSYTASGKYNLSNINYDLNGNIQSLQRSGESGTLIDNLIYHYNDKYQLSTLEELSDLTEGFKSNQTNAGYLYDELGRMYRDDHKGITITYNELNLPAIIAFDNLDSIKVIYDAFGKKLLKLVKGNNQSNWSSFSYFDEIEYANDQIQSIQHPEGRFTSTNNGFRVEYSIRDHLGNNRIMFADLNNDGKVKKSDNEILQEEHYYPFGMKMQGSWSQVTTSENQYQFNGKEFQPDFGLDWLDYEARWYDPSLARWNTMDPMAEKYGNMSPYNYVLNNPLSLTDPDGMEPEVCCKAYKQGPFIISEQASGGVIVKRMTPAFRKQAEITIIISKTAVNGIVPGLGDFAESVGKEEYGKATKDAAKTGTEEGLKHIVDEGAKRSKHKNAPKIVDGINNILDFKDKIDVGREVIEIAFSSPTAVENLTRTTFQLLDNSMGKWGAMMGEEQLIVSNMMDFSADYMGDYANAVFYALVQASAGFDLSDPEEYNLFMKTVVNDKQGRSDIWRLVNERLREMLENQGKTITN